MNKADRVPWAGVPFTESEQLELAFFFFILKTGSCSYWILLVFYTFGFLCSFWLGILVSVQYEFEKKKSFSFQDGIFKINRLCVYYCGNQTVNRMISKD